MMFNYGAFPQTWEDPNEVSPHTLHKGDNDPIDAIELGGRSWPTGSIVEVRHCCVGGDVQGYRARSLLSYQWHLICCGCIDHGGGVDDGCGG